MDLNTSEMHNKFLTPDRSYNNKTKFNSKMISTFSPQINDSRFISNRENKNNLLKMKDFWNTPNDISECDELEQNNLVYQNLITNKFLNFDDIGSLNDNNSFNSKYNEVNKSNFSNLNNEYNNYQYNFLNNIKEIRKRSKFPYKVLDAPGVKDDFYLNILDWSKNNLIGISLGNTLYFWDKKNENDENGGVNILDELQNQIFCSIKFSPNGNIIAGGNEFGNLLFYDCNTLKKINKINVNFDKISCLSFFNENLLSVGGKDNFIRNYDLRSNKLITTFLNHTKEIINLKWESNLSLLASGSEDNLINIWDLRKKNFLYCFNEHNASTKALEWSRLNKGYLISGGGNKDNKIIYWDVKNGTLKKKIDTESQVCNIIFSKNTDEIISTHGYLKNKIIIWDYHNLKKKYVIEGHSKRVLHSVLSPNGEDLATCSADETLKFWNIFPQKIIDNPINNNEATNPIYNIR